MAAGVATAPPPSLGNLPTGFGSAPEVMVPLFVTAIVLKAWMGMWNAELPAKILVPPA